MPQTHNNLISRRHAIAFASATALGASLQAATATSQPRSDYPTATYNIRDFGAKGDGTSLDTAAIQSAIDSATQTGGTVLVPAGDFVIGTVELKSNVTLHLTPKARLLGSPDIKHYHAGNGIPPSNGNIVLLSAANAENVSIEGPGTIDGQGAKFYNGRGDNTGPGQNSAQGYTQRPHLLVFYRCKNLVLRDAFLAASAYHCCRILECDRVRLTGVRIHNRVNKNNDGFHINSSRYVNIINCNVACQDDACALFGSNQFVTVTNCSFSTRWSVFRFGGGHASDITVSNCVIYETYGCPIKMRCGARSRFENILFSNLVMRDVTGPISIGLASGPQRNGPDGTPIPRGIVRNISFNNIRATVVATGRQHEDLPFPSSFRPGETRTCITLNAVGDEFLENISLTDVHATFEGGGTAAEASIRNVPEKAGEYFELGALPAYGIYARNVKGLTLSSVRLETQNPDLRPAVVLDHAQDVTATALAVAGQPNADSTLRLTDSRDVLLTATKLLTPAATFLQVEGARSENITIDGGDITKAAKPLIFASNAQEKAVRMRI